MRNATRFLALGMGMAVLAGCSSGSIMTRERPDEFAVQRQAPLVVPPDFALAPPKPGAPRPTEGTAAQQALDVLFGGPSARSNAENATLGRTGNDVDNGIRSSAGDTGTNTVDKGATTRTILMAPEGDGEEARSGIPGA